MLGTQVEECDRAEQRDGPESTGDRVGHVDDAKDAQTDGGKKQAARAIKIFFTGISAACPRSSFCTRRS